MTLRWSSVSGSEIRHYATILTVVLSPEFLALPVLLQSVADGHGDDGCERRDGNDADLSSSSPKPTGRSGWLHPIGCSESLTNSRNNSGRDRLCQLPPTSPLAPSPGRPPFLHRPFDPSLPPRGRTKGLQSSALAHRHPHQPSPSVPAISQTPPQSPPPIPTPTPPTTPHPSCPQETLWMKRQSVRSVSSRSVSASGSRARNRTSSRSAAMRCTRFLVSVLDFSALNAHLPSLYRRVSLRFMVPRPASPKLE